MTRQELERAARDCTDPSRLIEIEKALLPLRELERAEAVASANAERLEEEAEARAAAEDHARRVAEVRAQLAEAAAAKRAALAALVECWYQTAMAAKDAEHAIAREHQLSLVLHALMRDPNSPVRDRFSTATPTAYALETAERRVTDAARGGRDVRAAAVEYLIRGA